MGLRRNGNGLRKSLSRLSGWTYPFHGDNSFITFLLGNSTVIISVCDATFSSNFLSFTTSGSSRRDSELALGWMSVSNLLWRSYYIVVLENISIYKIRKHTVVSGTKRTIPANRNPKAIVINLNWGLYNQCQVLNQEMRKPCQKQNLHPSFESMM